MLPIESVMSVLPRFKALCRPCRSPIIVIILLLLLSRLHKCRPLTKLRPFLISRSNILLFLSLPFKKLPDYLNEDNWDVERKIDLILCGPPCNVVCKLWLLDCDYLNFSKDNISKMVTVCGDLLDLEKHRNMNYEAVNFLSWVDDCFFYIESIIFENSESSGLDHKEVLSFKQN